MGKTRNQVTYVKRTAASACANECVDGRPCGLCVHEGAVRLLSDARAYRKLSSLGSRLMGVAFYRTRQLLK